MMLELPQTTTNTRNDCQPCVHHQMHPKCKTESLSLSLSLGLAPHLSGFCQKHVYQVFVNLLSKCVFVKTHFLKKLQIPQTEKQVRQFYKSFIPRFCEKLPPFYNILHKEHDIVIETIHCESIFEGLKHELKGICQMTLRLTKSRCQCVTLGDTSLYEAGFVLMIEDYATSKAGKELKINSSVAFGSKIFKPAQLKI